VSLDDAKVKVMTSFCQGLELGSSMSPIWLEEWETAKILAWYSAAQGSNIVCVELHSKCVSNRQRSHVQVVLPSPDHCIGPDDQVFVLFLLLELLGKVLKLFLK